MIIEKLTNIYRRIGRRPYELSIITFLAAFFPFFRRYRDKINSIVFDDELIYYKWNVSPSERMIFCSELVTLILKEIGVIQSDVNPEDIVPVQLLAFVNQPIYF